MSLGSAGPTKPTPLLSMPPHIALCCIRCVTSSRSSDQYQGKHPLSLKIRREKESLSGLFGIAYDLRSVERSCSFSGSLPG